MNVARAQNLKSVSTLSTQDPYVKAKLLVDGYQVLRQNETLRDGVGNCCVPLYTGPDSPFPPSLSTSPWPLSAMS